MKITSMFSRFRRFLDKLKILKNHYLRGRQSEQFMEWEYDNKHNHAKNLSKENDLQKSMSDTSLASVNEYRLNVFKMSSMNDMLNNVTTVTSLDKLNDNSDDSEVDEIKTQEINSNNLVYFRQDILDFQGERHSPDEIAPIWKKDCRMWLWKSVRLAKKRGNTQIATLLHVSNGESSA